MKIYLCPGFWKGNFVSCLNEPTFILKNEYRSSVVKPQKKKQTKQ